MSLAQGEHYSKLAAQHRSKRGGMGKVRKVVAFGVLAGAMGAAGYFISGEACLLSHLCPLTT